jgi:hypothetical protein
VREIPVPLQHRRRAEHPFNQMSRTSGHTASARSWRRNRPSCKRTPSATRRGSARTPPAGSHVRAPRSTPSPRAPCGHAPAASGLALRCGDEARVVRVRHRTQQRVLGCVAGVARDTGRGQATTALVFRGFREDMRAFYSLFCEPLSPPPLGESQSARGGSRMSIATFTPA